MPMRMEGADELRNDLSAMASALSDSGGSTARILDEAAEPVLRQIRANASSNPAIRSGTSLGSIGKKTGNRKGRARVTVGVHSSTAGAYYAGFVEFGHGGPHPAPPHPFVRPAYDAAADEAYEQLKQNLIAALTSRGLL